MKERGDSCIVPPSELDDETLAQGSMDGTLFRLAAASTYDATGKQCQGKELSPMQAT